MKNKLDARGLMCPKPVIMTKKELEKLDKGSLTTIVDNEAAKENLSKLAQSMGYKFTVDEISKDEFHITISKDKTIETESEASTENLKDEVIILSQNKMGQGNDQLGEILVKSLMYTISETKPYPSAIIFYNTGVKLTCEGSEVLDELMFLEEKGVEIISCGTCLDFFEIEDKLKVGTISNMYSIYERIRKSKSNINIG
ncbi:MAG TPA: sulfurtransferase-like selenium metabolism protein YedF [Tissierellaceae bacterium]|nr:sulfurtransferase-like selenium metabolism protein YedF [Tissierellaceae bacterium]